MTHWTRRSALFGATALATTACSTGTRSTAGATIDRRVSSAQAQMFRDVPFANTLAQTAAGVLIIPKVRKAGLFLGGAYGEGSLLIGNAPVDYYSMAAASFGFQAGVQQYNTALFFMDPSVLAEFRGRDGWTLGADLEFVVLDKGADAAGLSTNTVSRPVYAITFGQRGLLAGASLGGSKYSRIIR